MAYRTKPLRPIQLIFSSSAFALLLLLTLGTVITLWLHADIGFQLLLSDWAIIKFTIFQALTSAAISILIAIANILEIKTWMNLNILVINGQFLI